MYLSFLFLFLFLLLFYSSFSSSFFFFHLFFMLFLFVLSSAFSLRSLSSSFSFFVLFRLLFHPRFFFAFAFSSLFPPLSLSFLIDSNFSTLSKDILACTLLVTIPIGILLIWQLFVVYANTTTVESMKKAWSTPFYKWPQVYWQDAKKGKWSNFAVLRGKQVGVFFL